jgi:hypothetical protein
MVVDRRRVLHAAGTAVSATYNTALRPTPVTSPALTAHGVGRVAERVMSVNESTAANRSPEH